MLRSVNKLATKFSSQLRRGVVRHSCDWAKPGAVYIGYQIDYRSMFKHTPYHHEELCNEFVDDFSGLMEAPVLTEDIEEKNSHKVLHKNWKSFLTEKHRNNTLLHEIQVRLDADSVPMCEDSVINSNYCQIAFGYNITQQKLEIRNEATESFVKLPENKFPVDMEHIIQDFVTYFRDKHFDKNLKAKDKYDTSSESKIVVEGPSLIQYQS